MIEFDLRWFCDGPLWLLILASGLGCLLADLLRCLFVRKESSHGTDQGEADC
jgi:hypothetical protein